MKNKINIELFMQSMGKYFMDYVRGSFDFKSDELNEINFLHERVYWLVVNENA